MVEINQNIDNIKEKSFGEVHKRIDEALEFAALNNRLIN